MVVLVSEIASHKRRGRIKTDGTEVTRKWSYAGKEDLRTNARDRRCSQPAKSHCFIMIIISRRQYHQVLMGVCCVLLTYLLMYKSGPIFLVALPCLKSKTSFDWNNERGLDNDRISSYICLF